MDSKYHESLKDAKKFTPLPPLPPPPPPFSRSEEAGCPCKCGVMNNSPPRRRSHVSPATRDLWEGLYDEGYNADVHIKTVSGGIVYAHSIILATASPVMRGLLKQANRHHHLRLISILGVPHDAVRVFIRFLYSSCYEEEEMEKLVLHLLVLSHAFAVPHLKHECEEKLELGLLTLDNVVDAFQLALLCDAPRLSLICQRMILKRFKAVSASQGWKAMKESFPDLEKELLETMIEENVKAGHLFFLHLQFAIHCAFSNPFMHCTADYQQRKLEYTRKLSERKVYLQLYEAMDALVHICRDGCLTIGPHDKDFKANQQPCSYAACKGVESLIRHFAGCKLKVPGGCIHCKRMWQLLELHSRLCADPDYCRVPLCRKFKEHVSNERKKDSIRWNILVEKILRTRGIPLAPCFQRQ